MISLEDSTVTVFYRWQVIGLGAVLVMTCAACNAAEPGGAPVTVMDSLGITIVVTTPQEQAFAEGLAIDSLPSLVIGMDEADRAYQFDRIVAVRVASNGHIVVGDGASKELRIFDAAGSHLVSAGGEGRGPGEFLDLSGFALSGDTVFVFDGSLARLTSFSLSGQLLDITPLEPTENPRFPLRLYRIEGFLGQRIALVARAFPANALQEPGTYWDTVPTLQYGRTGSRQRVIAEPYGMDSYSTADRSASMTFARLSSAAVAGEEIYMTDGGRYEVRVYGTASAPIRILRLDVEPRTVTVEMLDDFYDRWLQFAVNDDQRRVVQEMRASWPHTAALPWISDLEVDELGNLWAREYQHQLDPAPGRWGVFNDAGKWLGTIVLPTGFVPHHIGPDFMLGVSTDTLGIESVHQYRLVREQ